MWLRENRLKRKIAHLWLPFASQKRACISSLMSYQGHTQISNTNLKLVVNKTFSENLTDFFLFVTNNCEQVYQDLYQ